MAWCQDELAYPIPVDILHIDQIRFQFHHLPWSTVIIQSDQAQVSRRIRWCESKNAQEIPVFIPEMIFQETEILAFEVTLFFKHFFGRPGKLFFEIDPATWALLF